MNNTNFKSKIPNGRGLLSAPQIIYKNVQTGRSMIEMLGVLAIIGVLSVGGIAGYSKAMHRYKVNKTIEQITLIAGNIRSFFKGNYSEIYCSGGNCRNGSGCSGYSINSAGNPSDTFNGCPIIKKAKIFPEEMLSLSDDGTKIMAITNPFGFPASLDIANKNVYNDNKAFYIAYYLGDNIEACIELMTQDWTNANVNAIHLYNNSEARKYFKTPVSIDLATEKCSAIIASTTDADKTKGYPDIVFYFDIDLTDPDWKSFTWQN